MRELNARHYEKMTEWPVSKLVITLAIPTTISMLITNVYNMADTYFVGTIGNSASGAVGVVFGLMAIIQAFGFMLGHGAGSIIARHLGQKDVQSASLYASVSFFASLLAGLGICTGGLIFINPLIRLLGSTETILPYARAYAFYILVAAPLMAASCVLNNILRYEGRASLAMIGLTAGGILNIFGDWVFMMGFDMGIEGAGLSTALSQTVSFLILLGVFLMGKTQSRISFRQFAARWRDVAEVCKTGMPSMMRQGLNSVSTMVLNGQVRIYGDAAVAAMSIVNRICFFIFAVGLGIGQGFQPVAAFNYGAEKYRRVRKSFFFTFWAEEILLGLLEVAGMLLSGGLVGIFRNDPQVIEIGTMALRFQLVALLFQPLTVCANMMFQSIGKNAVATFLSMLRSGLCFIPTVYLLAFLWGLPGIEASQAAADVMTFAIALPFVLNFLKTLPDEKEKEEPLRDC